MTIHYEIDLNQLWAIGLSIMCGVCGLFALAFAILGYVSHSGFRLPWRKK